MIENETASANNHMGIAYLVWLGVCESGSESDSVWGSERVSLHVYPHSEALTWEVPPGGCCLFPICQIIYGKYSKHIQTDT